MNYILVTDSGCDVPKEVVDQYKIEIVPMHVTIGDETFDDYTVSPEKVYDYYNQTGKIPKTSGSTPEDNRAVYARIREQHPDTPIIHVAYSAVTTVSYNSAKIAAEEFENIYIIDSKNVTAGAAIIVTATAKFIDEHPQASPEDIVSFVEDVRKRTRFFFLPETLDYLKAGGRVSNAAFLVASLLKIHPSIVIEDGYLIASKKYRGKFSRCSAKMLDDFLALGDFESDSIVVGGTEGLDPQVEQAGKNRMQEAGYHNIKSFRAGPVISTHGGPGVFGVVGILKA